MDLSHRALIVDDEQDILNLLERVLAKMEIPCFSAASLTQAKQLLAKEALRISFCITDMRLPDGNGIELVKKISTEYPDIPVAMITAYGSVETAVEALQAGAFDFVSKPIELDVLRKLISNALRQAGNSEKVLSEDDESRLIGQSPAMLDLKEKIRKLARSQAPVLIHGESGTGKELVAREIHRLGSRADKPFIAVNCGAIPAELMESEFFGHRKGSFTGAVSDKHGLFEAADGGTLFLDEVAELPMLMQVKLLRAIQERAVKPVGAHHEVKVDVRILSATHKNLQQEVEEKRFRLDLFYRLNVIGLDIPPLRDRSEDLPQLADYLLQRIAKQSYADREFTLEQGAMDKLAPHHFSGNVRELENLLERACAFSEDGRVIADDIQFDNHQPVDGSSFGQHVMPAPASYSESEDERSQLVRVLEETHWNRTEAARRLGMTLRQIRYRIAKYDLES
jgi:two-component system response regulator PilR (NtrC family)